MRDDQVEWFLNRDGQQHGPINQREIATLIESGDVRLTDFVWRAGFNDWIEAARVAELFPPRQPVIPPPFRRPPPPVPIAPTQQATELVAHPPTNPVVRVGNFRDPNRITWWLKLLLYACIVTGVVSLVSNLMEYSLLADFKAGTYASQAAADAAAAANDARQAVAGFLNAGVLIITIIVFAIWIYRANYNARQLGAMEMKYSPGWSVGWYFIPFANLWKPYDAMKEIWLASKNPTAWSNEERGSILPWWWFFFIVSGILGNLSLRMVISAKTIDELFNVAAISIASDLVAIPSAFIALALVKQIHRFQTTNHVAFHGAQKP